MRNSVNKKLLLVILLTPLISIVLTYILFFQPNNIQNKIEPEITQKESVETISEILNTSMELEKISDKSETKLFASEIADAQLTQVSIASTELSTVQASEVEKAIVEQKKAEELKFQEEKKAKEEAEKEAKRKEQLEEQRKIEAEAKKKQEEKAKAKKAKRQVVQKQNAPVKTSQNDNILTINGVKYQIIEVMNNVHITAYDNGIESTGKRPGDRGYGITASGANTGWGSAAIDTQYHNFGDIFYIDDNHHSLNGKPNGKLFTAHDTGSAIKGKKRMDIWFGSKSEALQFGTQNLKVYKLKKL